MINLTELPREILTDIVSQYMNIRDIHILAIDPNWQQTLVETIVIRAQWGSLDLFNDAEQTGDIRMIRYTLCKFQSRNDKQLMNYALDHRLLLLVQAIIEDTRNYGLLPSMFSRPLKLSDSYASFSRLSMSEILFLNDTLFKIYLVSKQDYPFGQFTVWYLVQTLGYNRDIQDVITFIDKLRANNVTFEISPGILEMVAETFGVVMDDNYSWSSTLSLLGRYQKFKDYLNNVQLSENKLLVDELTDMLKEDYFDDIQSGEIIVDELYDDVMLIIGALEDYPKFKGVISHLFN